MYRFKTFAQTAGKFQRLLAKDVMARTAISAGLVVGITHTNSSYFSECDHAHINDPFISEQIPLQSSIVVRPTPIKSKYTVDELWDQLINQSKKAASLIDKAVRFTERIATYVFYSIPLVGLLPATYLFGSSVPELEETTWGYLIWAAQQLGPCFVKLAQWASTRPDLFPPKLVSHLVALQDDVKVNYPFSTVDKTLKDAFGSDWKNFLALDPKPIGTGSVAQVFKGVLKSNDKSNQQTQVAIKMIHPHVESMIKTDMELLDVFASFIDTFPSFEMLAIGDTCREFSLCMHQQLDLRIEASHLVKFAKKWAKDTWAQFPVPIEGFVTKNVMVETLMDGVPINHFLTITDETYANAEKLKMKLSDLGCRLILKMIFFDNFIHGDLHPGNILVKIKPNGEPVLVILDCGIVYSSKSDRDHETLVEICLAFMKHNGYEAGRLMLDNARQFQARNEKYRAKKIKNANDFCRDVQKLVEESETHSYFEHIGEYVQRICDLARNYSVRLDPGYFKIAMALKVAEGISLGLNRDLDLVSKCVPIITKARTMRMMGLLEFPAPEPDDEFIKSNSMHKMQAPPGV